MDEPRKFLESEVKTAEEKHADAVRGLRQAVTDYYRVKADLLAFRGALEVYTRNSERPYSPPELDISVESLINQEQASLPPAPAQPRPRKTETLPPIERTSKSGVIYGIIVADNGKGLKSKDIPGLQPDGLPFRITLEDVYRALPRLVKTGKIWRDKQGRYFLGRQSEHSDKGNELFNEPKET